MTFAEFSQLPIVADFSEGGLPLILSLSQGEMLTCNYVLATLAEDDNFQPSLETPQPQATNKKSQPIPAVPPAVGLLHSTQNENGNIDADMPDISRIPHPEPDVKSGSFEEPNENEIEGSPPAKKKTFLFRYCLDILLICYKVQCAGVVSTPPGTPARSLATSKSWLRTQTKRTRFKIREKKIKQKNWL